MQYKYQCICSNDAPLAMDLLADENHADCDYKCPGDYKSYCGGQWNMNIYNLTTPTTTTPNPATTNTNTTTTPTPGKL